MSFKKFKVPYNPDDRYSKKIAYFSMEFAVHQPLKIYSGGLGFLSGSHMRSAYELKQNLVGIGILWKYGYYDQARNQDQTLQVTWMEKNASFLEDTGIKFQVNIHEHPVWVKVYYLNPETFKSAPIFLLSTDLPENDYVSQTITHRLYDANVATKVAQFILLGVGGAKLMDEIGFNPDLYHLNEAHAISASFYLYQKFNKNISEVKKRLVFTTHTPEEAGNEKIYSVGADGGEVRLVIDVTSGVYSNLTIAEKAPSTILIANWESAISPAEIVKIDLTSRTHKALTRFNADRAASIDCWRI